MIKRVLKFHLNEKNVWHIDLPDWVGDPEDLQMIEGADLWLDLVSKGKKEVAITIANDHFEGAEFLTLIRLGELNLGGGGNYFLEKYQSNSVNLKVWLCKVVEFIFNHYPQRLYFSKA